MAAAHGSYGGSWSTAARIGDLYHARPVHALRPGEKRKISRPGFATVGSSNVPTFRTMVLGRIADSSAMDEPHAGQKCLKIGFPLPPMLLRVLSAPSMVTACLLART